MLMLLIAVLLFLTLAIPMLTQFGGINLTNLVGTLDSAYAGTTVNGNWGTPWITPTPTIG